jgi:cbb3-type cytochrome oxidase subunit 3
MSVLAIVLIVLGALLLLFFIGGLVIAQRRRAESERAYEANVTAADRALEQARAADKGWDRAELERLAREALARHRGGFEYGELVLVLVDDRPGVAQDRAHFLATGGHAEARVVLARDESGWTLDRVE